MAKASSLEPGSPILTSCLSVSAKPRPVVSASEMAYEALAVNWEAFSMVWQTGGAVRGDVCPPVSRAQQFERKLQKHEHPICHGFVFTSLTTFLSLSTCPLASDPARPPAILLPRPPVRPRSVGQRLSHLMVTIFIHR